MTNSHAQTQSFGQTPPDMAYTYAGNDPVNNIDPRGTDSCKATATVKVERDGDVAAKGRLRCTAVNKDRQIQIRIILAQANVVEFPFEDSWGPWERHEDALRSEVNKRAGGSAFFRMKCWGITEVTVARRYYQGDEAEPFKRWSNWIMRKKGKQRKCR